ncbi:uncharacterized protein [Triticum aestivum]|uniref:uncharacterized protein n=1 Tax=Triticum aestivum TaxID=4565 RepID=UPI001D010C50|nr:uncharacterized protein LOC123067297 [Triticum aestivum]
MEMQLPMWLIDGFEKRICAFFWKATDVVSGGHCLVAWEQVCKPFEYGGLGVLNLKPLGYAFRPAVEPEVQVIFDSSIKVMPGMGAHAPTIVAQEEKKEYTAARHTRLVPTSSRPLAPDLVSFLPNIVAAGERKERSGGTEEEGVASLASADVDHAHCGGRGEASPKPQDTGHGHPRCRRRRRDMKSRAAGVGEGSEEGSGPDPDPQPQVEVEYVPEKPDLGADHPRLRACVFVAIRCRRPSRATCNDRLMPYSRTGSCDNKPGDIQDR